MLPTWGQCDPGTNLQIHEADIATVHRMIRAGRITARQLVDASLARIDAYDQRGPALNTIICGNHQNCSVSLRCSRNHILYVVGMPWAIHSYSVR